MTEAPAPAQIELHRSPVPFIVIGATAVVSGIANWWGGNNFPYNAPVEQIEVFLLTVDFIAVAVLAVIGVIVCLQRTVIRPSNVPPIVGMALTAVSLLAVLVFAWIPSLSDLSNGYSLHYSTEVFPTLILPPVWITGLALCGFAYRRGGPFRSNLFCILGIAFGVLIFVLAAFSAVIYGLGLTT